MAKEGNSKQAENAGSNEENAENSEQVTSEEQAAPGEGLSVEALVEALAAAQAEIESNKDRVLRVSAEMENLRRRNAIDLENAHKFGLEKMASELLPVKDSLELGLAASSGDNVDLSKVVEGVDLTLKMMEGMMAKFGLVEVDPVNQKFNPEHHQAMSMQETAEVPANVVVNVFQKGYLLNERLLRPAMVVVSKAPAAGNGEGSAKIDEMA